MNNRKSEQCLAGRVELTLGSRRIALLNLRSKRQQKPCEQQADDGEYDRHLDKGEAAGAAGDWTWRHGFASITTTRSLVVFEIVGLTYVRSPS